VDQGAELSRSRGCRCRRMIEILKKAVNDGRVKPHPVKSCFRKVADRSHPGEGLGFMFAMSSCIKG